LQGGDVVLLFYYDYDVFHFHNHFNNLNHVNYHYYDFHFHDYYDPGDPGMLGRNASERMLQDAGFRGLQVQDTGPDNFPVPLGGRILRQRAWTWNM
jgi:hypothetical protein